MKTTLTFLLLTSGITLWAQNSDINKKASPSLSTAQSATQTSSLSPTLATDSLKVKTSGEKISASKKEKIQGKVTQVCENRGCWIIIENPNNEKFFVQMQDYSSLQGNKLKGKTVEVIGKSSASTKNSYSPNKDTGRDKNQVIRFTAQGVKVLD